MTIHGLEFVIAILLAGVVLAVEEEVPFETYYHLGWGHATMINKWEVQLLLDKESGGGFRSNSNYLSGLFGIKIKLSKNRSHGEIASFYLSDGAASPPHNEIDIEFFVEGNTYILQTNIYNDDWGYREQAFHLWLDPTEAYNLYQILWNPYLIVFMVNFIPIRVFRNYSHLGHRYPTKPMHIEASIWTAGWAGAINYTLGPFTANYRFFNVPACAESEGPVKCKSPEFIWNTLRALTQDQKDNLHKLRKNFMYRDYCINNPAPECHLPQD